MKIWIDPKDVQAPIKLKNVFWFTLFIDNLHLDVLTKNQDILSWISKFTNLKKIRLSFGYYDLDDIQLFFGDIATILTSPSVLKLAHCDITINCTIDEMLDMVKALGTMKDSRNLDCAIPIDFICTMDGYGCYYEIFIRLHKDLLLSTLWGLHVPL